MRAARRRAGRHRDSRRDRAAVRAWRQSVADAESRFSTGKLRAPPYDLDLIITEPESHDLWHFADRKRKFVGRANTGPGF